MQEIAGNSWYWFVLIGLIGGTLSGSLGVGAGMFVVPALVFGLGFQQKAAQGTCLAVMVPMAMMAAYRYHVNPDIKLNWTVILMLIPCAVAGAVLGSSIAAWLPAPVLRRAFGVFAILAGARFLIYG